MLLPAQKDISHDYPFLSSTHTHWRATKPVVTAFTLTFCPLFSQGPSLLFPIGLRFKAYLLHLSVLHVASVYPPPSQGKSFSLCSSAWSSPAHLFASSTFHLFANGIGTSLPPPCLSFSFVISFISGDTSVFTRQCLHIIVSCN